MGETVVGKIERQFYKHIKCRTESTDLVVAGVGLRKDGLRDSRSRNEGWCVKCKEWFPLTDFVWRGEGR